MSQKLLIVESPTKAKTISKFLGKEYRVLSSFGHIRDLPKSETGVDVEHDFAPTYVVPDKAKKHVAELKAEAKHAQDILLASDEDREGEAIAWHIFEVLKPDPSRVKRITFHEITRSAIEHAVAHPRAIDMHLVNAQQARRILDRLVGYELSPLLWKKVQRGLSAGRVQSVAVRLIVERERERQAFTVEEYWSIDAVFSKEGTTFDAKLASIDGKKLDKLAITNQAQADAVVKKLDGASFTVASVEKKRVSKAPPTPLTTSTLQQAANNAYGFSAKQTMTLAQKLYETGRITYMRTDSMNLSDKFLEETQIYLRTSFGDRYATGAKRYKTKKQGAQEAHEAIRPTDPAAATDSVELTDAGMRKLYDLIWRRTLASQMPAAELERTSVDVEANGHVFRANGNTVVFDGFLKVFHSGKETLLPELTQGDAVHLDTLTPTQHFTEPPARYSDATLVKALEEYGIGRPSTYAPTISTITDRGYIDRDDNKKLFPLDIAFIVNDVLVEHFPNIVDYQFTAKLENDLDEIAAGTREWVPSLREFYEPFHRAILEKSGSIKREDVMKERSLGTDPQTGLEVVVRTGQFGPYVQLGKPNKEEAKAKKGEDKPKRASLLSGMSMETISLEEALRLFTLPRTLGKTSEGEEILAAVGRFGPYLKAGAVTASLPTEISPLEVTKEQALVLLAQSAERKKKMLTPIAELGKDPTSGGDVVVRHGRFGPYITDGITNVSVPKKLDPASVDLATAADLLTKKRARPPRPKRGKK